MNKQKIIFITSNKGKLKEAQSIIPGVVGQSIDLPEIQEVDARKVVEAKLKEAYKRRRGEYIVEDTSLYFECLNGLPGPLIKWFLEKLGDKKLAELAKKLKNTRAEAKTIIGYIDKNGKAKFFKGTIKGRIVSPRGAGGFGWDKIFMPDGFKKTFGEISREEKNKISMRKKALIKLAKYFSKSEPRREKQKQKHQV
jgi:non-canonical purine NTP pyrophosphatase (RdgB/HAM1 family)